MVEIVEISEAKDRLCELLAKAEMGQTVLIARGNTPVVQLVPIEIRSKRRMPGRLAHWAAHGDSALFEPDPEQNAIDAGDHCDELGIWVGKTKTDHGDEDPKP